MSGNVNQVNVSVLPGGTLAVGTTYIYALSAPTASIGGGITVVGVNYGANAAIAAGSAPNITLVKKTAAGVVNGTIATATGSAAFTAGTTRTGTLSTVFLDAGEQAHVMWAQTAANADTPGVNAVIQYVMGR